MRIIIVLLVVMGATMGNKVQAGQLTAMKYFTDDQERNVSVLFKNEPLADALHVLANKVNVGISYNTNMLPPTLINYRANDTSYYKVLEAILAGTGLYADLSDNQKVILIKKRIPRARTQTGTITGTVTDAQTGEPLPGANIYIESINKGVSTNNDGKFSISGIEPGTYTVRVSFIGYQALTKEIIIEDEQTTTVDFPLKVTRSELDELVVTAGYNIRGRSQPTGAISGVSSDAIGDRTIQTVDQALQGQSTGLRMVNTSGQPGGGSYIRIRGMGSITAGSDPLYIVDGTRLEPSYQGTQNSSNILQGLNPNDIGSVEVLKDAAATSLYGADGSNGVVLITTKRGRAGETQFSASTQVGFSEQTFEYDLMNGPDFVRAMQEAYANRYQDLGRTQYNDVEYGDPLEAGRQAAIDEFGSPDDVGTYDWYGSMLQPGLQKKVNLSARGGTQSTRFYISGGFNDQEGTIVGSEFNRFSLRTNVDHKATEKLSFNLNLNLSRSKTVGKAGELGYTDANAANWINSPFHGGVTTRVTSPIYNPDGTYNQDSGDLAGVLYNNVQVLNEEERWTRNVQLIGGIAGTYNFTDNLSFRSRWNLDYRLTRDHRFNNPSINRYNNYGGSVYDRTREVTSWNTDQVLDYQNTFAENHRFNVLLGVEYQHMYREQHYAEGEQLPSSLFNTINAAAVNDGFGGTFAEYKKAGAFSRLEYSYDDRYTVTGNLRYDGSSRFGEDRRFGLFYSAGLAWNMVSESFMDGVDFVSELKPRISYGTTGNSDIGNYPARAFFGTAGSYDGITGLRPTQLGNSTLSWEVAKSFDIGVDWSLFNDRLNGTFDLFRKNNENLLLNRTLPNNSGFSSITDNVGTVRNDGFEIEIGGIVLDKGKFYWDANFNLTYERSEIIELVDGQESIGNTIRVGYPRQIRWGNRFAGVNPADGRPMWYDEDGNLTFNVTASDDGPIGSQLPDYYGGFSNQFSYGSITLNMLFYYEYGKDIRNYQRDVFMLAPHRGRTLTNQMFDRWQQPGDITVIPRMYSESSFPGGSSVSTFDTRGMQDGSFIRLKNVKLQYQVPVGWLEKLNLNSLSVFVQSENLITWTAFDGPDPEVIAQTQTYYPQPRTFTGGVSVDF